MCLLVFYAALVLLWPHAFVLFEISVERCTAVEPSLLANRAYWHVGMLQDELTRIFNAHAVDVFGK